MKTDIWKSSEVKRMKLISLELKKIHPLVLAFFIGLLGAFVFAMYRSDREKYIYENLCRKFIEEIKAVPDESVSTYLDERIHEASSLIEGQDENRSRYIRSEISFDEFHEMNMKIEKAKKELAVLEKLRVRSLYFDSQREEGKETDWFYDEDVSRFLVSFSSADVVFVFVLAFAAFAAGITDSLYKSREMVSVTLMGKMIPALRILIIVLLCICAGVLTYIPALVLFAVKGFNEIASMRVCSISLFSGCPDSVGLREYLAIAGLKRVCIAILICIPVFLVSFFLPGKIKR